MHTSLFDCVHTHKEKNSISYVRMANGVLLLSIKKNSFFHANDFKFNSAAANGNIANDQSHPITFQICAKSM